LAIGCKGSGLGPLLDRLHSTRTRPVSLDVLNAPAAKVIAASGLPMPPADWMVVVGFEDNTAAVSWQTHQVMEEVAPFGVVGLQARAGETAGALWQGLTELDVRPAAALSFKANLLSGAVAAYCQHAAGTAENVLLVARAGSGIVRGHIGGDLTVERAASILKGLQEQATATQGNVVLTHAPAAWKRLLPVWGVPRDDVRLMRRVKEVFDPRDVFNPGRFV